MIMEFNRKQQVQEELYRFPYHYADLYPGYCPLYVAPYLALLKYAKDCLHLASGESILDLGCGDARFVYEMRNDNAEVIGIDYSEKALSFAKAFNPERFFYTQDLRKLNLPRKFHGAVMIETLEHIIPDDIPAVMRNIKEVLYPGSRFVVTVPSVNLPVSEKHYQHFSEESLAAVLSPHFEIKDLHGYDRNDFHRNLFRVFNRLGCVSFALSQRIPFLKQFHHLLKEYYKDNFLIGNPEECRGLIAVCEANGSF